MKVLLVENDQPTVVVLSKALATHYYAVDVVDNSQTALELATSLDYDLILLNWLIPKLDGLSLCRQLRSQEYQKPILLLTEKDSSADIVRGLDAGADDYVIKPYNLSELLARIRALLRRGKTNLAPTVLTWEYLCVNTLSAEVTYRRQKLSLTPKEYSLLGLFLQNPQRVFNRRDIIDRLWSIEATPCEGAVTNLIKDLRQKLKWAGITADLLETIYGLGYRLRAPSSIQEHSGVSSDKKNRALTTQQTEPTQASLVLAIDRDASFTEQLRSDASAWGLRIETAADLTIARQKMAQSPNVVLLALSWHDTVKDELQLLQDFREHFPTVPVLVISEQDSLRKRVLVSRLGGRGFLLKPIAPAQIFKAITQFLSTKPPIVEVKVMLIEDNPKILMALSAVLPPRELRVTSLQDPEQLWSMLNTTYPDLLIMDLEMLTFSGLELCQVVRQDLLWGNLPILVVTAYTDTTSIQRVFAAGADDFIGKPVVGPELVTRALSQIAHSRLQQQSGMKSSHYTSF